MSYSVTMYRHEGIEFAINNAGMSTPLSLYIIRVFLLVCLYVNGRPVEC